MKYIKTVISTCCLAFTMHGLFAGNPVVPDVGMADPHIKIFNDKAYLFATRDAEKYAKTFVMPDWHIWSSDDLVNWKHETVIYPSETYMGTSNNCWATDAVERDGKYIMYFSNKNINTGVMVADSPSGEYVDALGKPMLDANLTTTKEYDPTVLIDDDGSAYIVFGHYRKTDPELDYYIARLADDMISLAEEPKPIVINGDINVLTGNDKPNLHKKNGLYYLSAGSHYATSTNVYGPYERRGNSGNDKFGLGSRAHGNYFDWNKQSFHTWCNFYLGKDVGRYRESYITYLHYKENGEMVDDTDFLDKHFETGVGQYDANWDKIQAEWYMAAEHVKKKECSNGGFEISETRNGSTLFFPNIKDLENVNSISFEVSSNNGGMIEIYADNTDGKLLAKCEIQNTGDWKTYKKTTCKLENITGVENICFRFVGAGNDLIHLDWFKFNN